MVIHIKSNVGHDQFQCCGVDSYRDFNESNAWEKHPIPNNPSLTLQTPIACCKTLPSGTLHSDFMCAIQYNSLTSNGEMVLIYCDTYSLHTLIIVIEY